MKSRTTLKGNHGFTLIEILVALGIVAILFTASSFLNFNSYNRELLESEQETLVSVLITARSRSMNNIDASRHGVKIEDDNFILFRELPYDEEIIPRNSNVKNTSTLDTVIFEQLSGEIDNFGEIILSENLKTKKITLLQSGLIDW